MTPRIDIVPLDKRTPGIKQIDARIHPRLAELYANRAERLRQLAEGHADAGYLHFAASVVDSQARALALDPSETEESIALQLTLQSAAGLAGDETLWRTFTALLDGLQGGQPVAPTEAVLGELRALTRSQLAQQALALLQGRADACDARYAVFLWAALSLTWARRAARSAPPPQEPPSAPAHEHELIHGHAHPVGGGAALCPVCGCTPTGSLILTGDRAGLRYLQCSLCETRWHLVRATCSNCDSAAALDYWSFEQPGTAVKAESCGDCGGYLKVVYLEQDPAAEVVADDLGSLALDVAVAEQGFQRTGFNPFAFAA